MGMFAWKQQFVKECVTAHWSKVRTENNRASSYRPKLYALPLGGIGREHYETASKVIPRGIAGAVSKENVGISNDKQGEKPYRRKSKGS